MAAMQMQPRSNSHSVVYVKQHQPVLGSSVIRSTTPGVMARAQVVQYSTPSPERANPLSPVGRSPSGSHVAGVVRQFENSPTSVSPQSGLATQFSSNKAQIILPAVTTGEPAVTSVTDKSVGAVGTDSAATITADPETQQPEIQGVLASTKQKVSELVDRGLEVANEPRTKVTAASAAAGGAVVGAGGGAVGLTTGGMVGAAVGVVPAVFTFGLSIPVCAMVGGATGLCVGTAAGSTVGAVGGGAAGYGVYGKKDEIRDTVSGCASYVKESAIGSRVLKAFSNKSMDGEYDGKQPEECSLGA